MMVPHHQGAIRMAQIELAEGNDEETKSLARAIIEAQSREITQMNEWRTEWYGSPSPAGGIPDEAATMEQMEEGDDSGMSGMSTSSPGGIRPGPARRAPAAGWRLLPGALLLALMLGALFAACGGGDDESTAPAADAIEHVHGLGINSADGALMIATHGGLFRVAEDQSVAERVGESTQDTMGFTVVEADTFLGSGHPGANESGSPHLGLIQSNDGGETWKRISLTGEADFHTLRYVHDRVYAVDGLTGRLMISRDLGESWETRDAPPGLIDLVVDPRDQDRIVVATQRGLLVSEDGGGRWRPLTPEVGLLAWPAANALILVDARGRTSLSRDVGRTWTPSGEIGGQPTALTDDGARELYAARADGAVLVSGDEGASWDVRVPNRP